jgi:predicted RNase H-like HicB family nuclease
MKGGGGMICSVVVTQEEDWYVARDVVTGVASQGRTIDSAMSNLKEALELFFEDVPVEERVNARVFMTTMEGCV